MAEEPTTLTLVDSVSELLGALERVELLGAPDRIDRFKAALEELRSVHFQVAWVALARDGWCDEWGSAEQQRLESEWRQRGRWTEVSSFIRLGANRGPFGG